MGIFIISSGVTSAGMTLTSGDSMLVSNGGTASGIIVAAGGQIRLNGGTASCVVISSGGEEWVRLYNGNSSYDHSALIDGGLQRVSSAGGYAYSATVRNGGCQSVYSGGVVSDTLVSGPGVLMVNTDGSAYDATILSGGTLRIHSDGVISGAEIASGGSMYLSSGAVLQGNILLGGSMTLRDAVNAAEAVVTLDLRGRTVSDTAVIGNYELLGNTTLAISVTADQTSGVYKLASNAAAFDRSVNLTVDGSGNSLNLSFGHIAQTATTTYTLARGEDKVLTLAIGKTSQIDDTLFPVMSAYTETGPLTFGMGNFSEFSWNNGVYSSGYICCISGIETSDWIATDDAAMPYIFIHEKIVDAEKSDTNSLDNLWCGENTCANMLEWAGHMNRAGWQSADQFVAHCISIDLDLNVTKPERAIFLYIENSWKINAWNTIDDTGPKNTWLRQADEQLRSGNYTGLFSVLWGTPDNVTGNHSMTLLGFTYDTNYSPDDPRYYSGVILADSDDYKWSFDRAADTPNRVKIKPLVWDEAVGTYWYGDGTGFFNAVGTMRKMDTPGTADLTWYRPNEWSTQMTVNTASDAAHDQAVLRDNEALKLNFAVTNTGAADSGKFYVSLYVDDTRKETFKVENLSLDGIAAIRNYDLGSLSAGTHEIRAVIDSEDNVSEEFETNNVYRKTVVVTAAAARLPVLSAGGFVVSNGETAAAFDVSSGARVHLRGDGATASDAVVSSGGTLFVSSGGTLADSVIGSGGKLYVSSQGRTSRVTLVDNQATVSGGTCTDDIVSSGGVQDVFSGGVVSRSVVSSGGKILLAGGQALDAVVSNGGSLYVRSNNSNLSYASGAQIFSGGFMDVYDSSTAEGTVIREGGYVRVRNFGIASNTRIESGASMYVYSSGGLAVDTVVSGFARVYDEALMSNTVITSGASFHLWRGGIMKDAEVQYGGLLDIRESAPVLSGNIRVAGQLKASFDQNIDASGAIVTLDLTGRTTEDDHSIINLDYLGDTSLSVTVSADQSAGVYKLASRAAQWDSPIALTVQGETTAHDLSLGVVYSGNGKSYTLGKGDNGDLSLSVSNATDATDDCIRLSPYTETGRLHVGALRESTFEMEYKGSVKKVTVAGVSNLTASDWFSADGHPIFRNSQIADANKSIVASWDNNWCEPYTKANVLAWTGLAALAGYTDEDDLFKEYLDSKTEFGHTIFFEEHPELRTYYKTRFYRFNSYNESTHNHTGMAQAAANLATGQYVGYLQFTRGEIGNVTGSHAVTIYGFVTDESRSVDDMDYYCGVVIADNNYNGNFSLSENSEKELKIVGIHWDAVNEIYCLEDDYKGFFAFIELYQVLEQPGAADLIWYRPDDWSSALTVGTDTADEADILYDSDDLLVSFAVTNQGAAAAGGFHVSLYVDDELSQMFMADPLAPDEMSACLRHGIGKLDEGSHTLKIVIDPENNVAENYEQNNVFTKTIDVHHSGDAVAVNSGEEILIHSQALLVVGSGGWCQVVGENTCLASATVLSGGSLVCHSGNKLRDTMLSAAKMSIGDGTTAERTVLSSGAVLVLRSGGLTEQSIVSSGGGENVYSGGITSSAAVLSGGSILLAGGIARDAVILSGGVEMVRFYDNDPSSDFNALVDGGLQRVYLDGGCAYSATVRNGGVQSVYSGGVVSDTLVSGPGSLMVNTDGSAYDATILSGGTLRIHSDGVISGAEIVSGGSMYLSSGAVLKGNILLGGSMNLRDAVDATEAVVTLDLSGRTAADAAMVNNLALVQGTPDFTISVSANQANGTYRLADGAAGFASTVTICNTDGVCASFTVGETVTLGGQSYSLNLADRLLSLTVGGSAPTPTPLPAGDAAGDLNADGRADVIMSITQEGHGAYGATGAWLILSDQTAAWGDLSQRGEGWEIFGTGRTTAGKATADVYVRSTGNVIGAWTTGDDGKVSGWETIGEFSRDTQIVGLGDFNGNGQTDLLLRNTNGAVGCFFTDGEGWNYFQSLGDEWKLSAIGDLNGDGRDDVVLKHDAGFAGSWLTQADGTMAWADLDTLPDGFAIVGAGDFNGDGTDDVLLQKGSYFGAWLVQNGNAAGWMGLGDLPNVTVEQIADFDGDGTDDLRVWTTAGDLGTQLVKGEDTLEWKYYGSVGDEWSTSLAAL